MKPPVVSGSEAVKAFRKAGYELDGSSTGATSFFDATIRRIGASPFQITKSLRRGLFEP